MHHLKFHFRQWRQLLLNTVRQLCPYLAQVAKTADRKRERKMEAMESRQWQETFFFGHIGPVMITNHWLGLYRTQEYRFFTRITSDLWQITSVDLWISSVPLIAFFMADYVCTFVRLNVWFTFLWQITVNSTSFCANDQFSNLNCSSVSGDLPASKIKSSFRAGQVEYIQRSYLSQASQAALV